MCVRVTEAQLVRDHVIRVRFNHGSEGEVDLSDELDGPVFEPLKDPEVFARFRVDPDTHTIVWPNGADLAPEFLQDRSRRQQEGYRE